MVQQRWKRSKLVRLILQCFLEGFKLCKHCAVRSREGEAPAEPFVSVACGCTARAEPRPPKFVNALLIWNHNLNQAKEGLAPRPSFEFDSRNLFRYNYVYIPGFSPTKRSRRRYYGP